MKNDTNKKELENIKLDDEIVEKVATGITVDKVRDTGNEDGRGPTGYNP